MPEAAKWLLDVLDPAAKTPLLWLRERFPFVAKALREGRFSQDAAIIPQLDGESRLTSVEIDGGRDAKFVVVYARAVPADWRPNVRETLTYGRQVAGTDLIYDLTGEFLQGKARPFLADFRELPLRVYALLPYQVERIDLAVQQRVEVAARSESGGVELPIRLRFLDGRGEPIDAPLPFCAEFRDSAGKVVARSYSFTQPERKSPSSFCAPIVLGGPLSLTVRSLLTGEEKSTRPIQVVAADGRRPRKLAELTRDGLQVRRAPRPAQLDAP